MFSGLGRRCGEALYYRLGTAGVWLFLFIFSTLQKYIQSFLRKNA
jgi:hypothetical protein